MAALQAILQDQEILAPIWAWGGLSLSTQVAFWGEREGGQGLFADHCLEGLLTRIIVGVGDMLRKD